LQVNRNGIGFAKLFSNKIVLIVLKHWCTRYGLLVLLFYINKAIYAQDTIQQNKIDSLLSRPKGFLGQLTQSLLTDTTGDDENLQRNDLPYLKYEGHIIRNVIIQSLEFGTLTKDTVRRIDKRLARFANNIHYKTRPWVVRNNLFFHENDKLSPYLLGNN
jgi:hypothetical protein